MNTKTGNPINRSFHIFYTTPQAFKPLRFHGSYCYLLTMCLVMHFFIFFLWFCQQQNVHKLYYLFIFLKFLHFFHFFNFQFPQHREDFGDLQNKKHFVNNYLLGFRGLTPYACKFCVFKTADNWALAKHKKSCTRYIQCIENI